MFDDRTPLLALAMTAALLLSGCIGDGTDSLGFSSDEDAADTARINLKLGAGNLSSSDLAHLGLQIDGVFLHDAETPFPDGYHDVNTTLTHADIVTDGSSVTAVVADGSVPAATYDQILLRLAGVDIQSGTSGNASGGHGGHDHGNGDHDHGASPTDETSLGAIDLPLNVSFEAAAGETTRIELVLDVGASTEDGFEPVFETVTVTSDDETLVEETDVTPVEADGPAPATPEPAARMAVFGPNGDQAYKPGFTVEDGVFVNSQSSAFEVGSELRFSGTDSSPVATGATIEGYSWDFDDGDTATGPTVAHAFENPGVYEVELTVTDSNGVSATHMVRVVTDKTSWTTLEANTSFEESAEGWTATTSADSPAGGFTTWARDGDGRDSPTAWRAGFHQPGAVPGAAPDAGPVVGYGPGDTATLSSPEYEIPSNWTKAGFRVWVSGASSTNASLPGAGVQYAEADPFVVSYTTSSGSEKLVGWFAGSQDWVELGGLDALAGHAGETVQFHFTFTTHEQPPGGAGWYVDDFELGGVDLPVHKAHLLEEGGGHDHGGHDH